MAGTRAIIFDLDGVLTDTAEFHYLAWKSLAEEEGLPFDREANEQLRGVSRGDSLRFILGDREVDEGRFEEMMARKNALYLASLEEMGPGDSLPGAIDLLLDARRRGWLVALGSSSRNARGVLDKLAITSLFEVIADGNSVEQAKPAPDLFLYAARELGVPPSACVVVEDAASGVDAALAAGMRVIGIGPAERVGQAHHRADTPAQVKLGEAVPERRQRRDDGASCVDGWILEAAPRDDTVASPVDGHMAGNGRWSYPGIDADAGEGSSSVPEHGLLPADDGEPSASTVGMPGPVAFVTRCEAEATAPAVRDAPDRGTRRRRFLVRYAEQRCDDRDDRRAEGAPKLRVEERFVSLADLALTAQRLRIVPTGDGPLEVVLGVAGPFAAPSASASGAGGSPEAPGRFSMRLDGDHGRVEVAHRAVIRGAEVVGLEDASVRYARNHRVRLVTDPDREVTIEQFLAVVPVAGTVEDARGGADRRAEEASIAGYERCLLEHAVAWESWWAGEDRSDDDDLCAQLTRRIASQREALRDALEERG